MGHCDLSQICANEFQFRWRHTIATDRSVLQIEPPLDVHRKKSTAVSFRSDKRSIVESYRWLSEDGDLSARKSDKSAITGHILDKEKRARLKYFSDEPHVGNFFLPRPLPSDLHSPLSSSLLPISSLLLRCISYSIDRWKLMLSPSKSINAIPISMANRWLRIVPRNRFLFVSGDRTIDLARRSYYLHSDLFRRGRDPYNHRHVFNISFTGNGAHACRAA